MPFLRKRGKKYSLAFKWRGTSYIKALDTSSERDPVQAKERHSQNSSCVSRGYGAPCIDAGTDCSTNSVPDECEPGVPLDIPRFVGVLTGTKADPVDACLADANGDGGTDGLDIQTFVDGLLGP